MPGRPAVQPRITGKYTVGNQILAHLGQVACYVPFSAFFSTQAARQHAKGRAGEPRFQAPLMEWQPIVHAPCLPCRLASQAQGAALRAVCGPYVPPALQPVIQAHDGAVPWSSMPTSLAAQALQDLPGLLRLESGVVRSRFHGPLGRAARATHPPPATHWPLRQYAAQRIQARGGVAPSWQVLNVAEWRRLRRALQAGGERLRCARGGSAA